MIAPAIVDADEGRDGRIEVSGHLVRHLVYSPLQRLLVALQLPVGLRVERGCQDVLDAGGAQVVAECS